jgi:hypothetical protein
MHPFDTLKISILGEERDIRVDVTLARCTVRPRKKF